MSKLYEFEAEIKKVPDIDVALYECKHRAILSVSEKILELK